MRHIILGRQRPTTTDPALIYKTPDNGTDPTVTTIIVTKTIVAAASYSIYFNARGTYDETTAPYFTIELPANRRSVNIEFVKGMGMGNLGDTLHVRSHTANAFTFHVFGEVRK